MFILCLQPVPALIIIPVHVAYTLCSLANITSDVSDTADIYEEYLKPQQAILQFARCRWDLMHRRFSGSADSVLPFMSCHQQE